MDTFRKAVKKALENSTDINTDIGIGDMVEFKVSVKNYYPPAVWKFQRGSKMTITTGSHRLYTKASRS